MVNLYTKFDFNLYSKILKNIKTLKTQKRNTLILPEYVNKIIFVYDGYKYKKLKIINDMVGLKLGQFIFTRKYCNHKFKKKRNTSRKDLKKKPIIFFKSKNDKKKLAMSKAKKKRQKQKKNNRKKK